MDSGIVCKNCGHLVPGTAKFCGNCGTRVEEETGKIFCSTCGEPLEAGAKFCPSCGVKVEEETNSDTNTTPQGVGKLLTTLKMVSLYEGEPKVGIAKASGPLSVYDDRLEFKKQMGNALGGAFGLVGMAVAQSKVKNDPLLVYPVSQIAQLRVGKYGGVYNTLVVVMKDGTTVSFCPAAPASAAPQSVIDSLSPYMQKR